MDFTASTIATILAVIGILALIVSIITEVTKGVAVLSKIPTNLQVIVLSITLTLVAYFAYITYSGSEIIWYYIVADIIAGFTVAYVTLYGWDKLAGLYKKFRNIPAIDLPVTSEINTNVMKAVDSIDTSFNSAVPGTTDNDELVNPIEGETDDTTDNEEYDFETLYPDSSNHAIDDIDETASKLQEKAPPSI